MSDREADLERIGRALDTARAVLAGIPPGPPRAWRKAGGDPVTDVDLAIDGALRDAVPCAGEGWLSEETADAPARLSCRRVWVVDPIDGTRQYVAGNAEWSISVALVEDGRAVAGGVWLPAVELTVIGAEGAGVRADGVAAGVRREVRLADAEILASRSEYRRGVWERYRDAPFRVRPFGSVAAKLALVAAGRADATWTLEPRNEWDVAAGVALVVAAGGEVWLPSGEAPRFNLPRPVLPGIFAAPPGLAREIRGWFAGLE